jgi:hypothetical protein
MAIWYILPRLGMLYQEQSGKPGPQLVAPGFTFEYLFRRKVSEMDIQVPGQVAALRVSQGQLQNRIDVIHEHWDQFYVHRHIFSIFGEEIGVFPEKALLSFLLHKHTLFRVKRAIFSEIF